MNSIQKKYGISDRKFRDSDIVKGYEDTMAKIKSGSENEECKKILESAEIPCDDKICNWIRTMKDNINLYNMMDILDGCDRTMYSFNNEGYTIRSTPMNNGDHKISILYNERGVCLDSDKDELPFVHQMAYDIYSGCPRFVWIMDIDRHIKTAINIINSAKSGITFRRDIFSCEAYGITFVPVDIVNIKMNVGKYINDVPYIMGYLCTPKNVMPYVMRTSLINPSNKYLNEETILPGEKISLAGMNNLFIDLINNSKVKDEDYDTIVKKALRLLVFANSRHENPVRVANTIRSYTNTEYNPNLGYIDDYDRRNAKQLNIFPDVLRYTKYQTIM